MDLLEAIKREERKLEKELGKLQHKLNGVRAAAKALGESTSPDGKWTATVLTRDCGAATTEYMAVNLHDFEHKHLDPENDPFVTKHVVACLYPGMTIVATASTSNAAS